MRRNNVGRLPFESDGPLHVVARQGDTVLCSKIINQGANLQTVDAYNQTALHVASRYGHEAIVKLLLSTNKININAVSKFGRTALQ